MSREVGPSVVKESPGVRLICACGRSGRLPYCDGSHLGTGIQPVVVTIRKERQVTWCRCGKSGTFPLCDEDACA